MSVGKWISKYANVFTSSGIKINTNLKGVHQRSDKITKMDILTNQRRGSLPYIICRLPTARGKFISIFPDGKTLTAQAIHFISRLLSIFQALLTFPEYQMQASQNLSQLFLLMPSHCFISVSILPRKLHNIWYLYKPPLCTHNSSQDGIESLLQISISTGQ